MLEGFMGALLRVDKAAYNVGERTEYIITGAQPDAVIAWTSFRNGQPTGEFNAQYGQYVGANGSWSEVTEGAWPASMMGQWQKIALLINPDGSMEQAQVNFRVGPTGAAASGGDGDFFSDEIEIPGLGPVPTVALVAAVGLGLLAITKR